jgi:membrane fusion protein, multidrug efflux system
MRFSERILHNKPNLFAFICCAVVLIALGINLYHRFLYVSSNNALVEGHSVALGSKISGTVERVFVEDHQFVKKGDLLCLIDDRDYRNALIQTQTKLESITAQQELAKKDLDRSLELFKDRSTTASLRDSAQARYDSLSRELEADRAQREVAELNLAYTRVLAPADGVIAVRTAQPGMQLKVGSPLFGFVYPNEKPDDRWVIAKIKETDIADVKVGESVEVKIDAIPHRSFAGHVLNLSPASEGPFASTLVDNAAGNFTKYVQWIPVKIALNLSPEDLEKVRVGLSAEVTLRR